MERFEINRSITGMGHDRYVRGEPILGDRPSDQLARTLLAHGGIDRVSINSNVITVEVARGGLDIDEVTELIGDLFTYYRPGVEVPAFVTDDADGDAE